MMTTLAMALIMIWKKNKKKNVNEDDDDDDKNNDNLKIVLKNKRNGKLNDYNALSKVSKAVTISDDYSLIQQGLKKGKWT